MTDISKLLKDAVKQQVEQVEYKLEVEGNKLEKRTTNLLDINKDGQLTVTDFILLILEFVDTNGDGRVSIWEIITVLFQIRKILRKLKK